MADTKPSHRYPIAAYLYVLHLDASTLAWEYLRRNPDYQRDWQTRRNRAASFWGLRLLEDPALDGRDAHPVWFPDHESVIRLEADADPALDAMRFHFWRIPGRKQLVHDGNRLMVVARQPGCCLHLELMPSLEEGVACACAVRVCSAPCAPYRALADALETLTRDCEVAAVVRRRPSRSVLLELLTLQALDTSLTCASLREVAEALFGPVVVATDWHADGALRARVRRLVRRGQTLMRGGYRRLAQLPDSRDVSPHPYNVPEQDAGLS
jgi:hypothetical protein